MYFLGFPLTFWKKTLNLVVRGPRGGPGEQNYRGTIGELSGEARGGPGGSKKVKIITSPPVQTRIAGSKKCHSRFTSAPAAPITANRRWHCGGAHLLAIPITEARGVVIGSGAWLLGQLQSSMQILQARLGGCPSRSAACLTALARSHLGKLYMPRRPGMILLHTVNEPLHFAHIFLPGLRHHLGD